MAPDARPSLCVAAAPQLMVGSPDTKVDLKELAEKQQLVRSQVLRTNCGYLPESAFRERRQYFTAKVGQPRPPPSPLPLGHPATRSVSGTGRRCCILIESLVVRTPNARAHCML